MYKHIDIVIIIIAIILLFLQPHNIIKYTNTFIGRLTFVIIIILASLYSTLAATIVSIVFVIFTNIVYEGMTLKDVNKGSVSDELLQSSNNDTNLLNQNTIENTKLGKNIIGDDLLKDTKNDSDSIKGTNSSGIIFSNVPSNANFIKNHCKTKPGTSIQIFVDEKGKELKMSDIKKKYPLNFTNGIDCDPCDNNCSYTITDSVEQLYNEENLRSKQASMFK